MRERAVAAALAALIAGLAALQYRWVGRVGEADAARLRAGAAERAGQLARDFDREVTRASAWLRVDPETARSRDGRRYAPRWERWSRRAPQPLMVRAVYVTAGDALFRFEPGSSSFRPAEWPEALRAVRERVLDLEGASAGPGLPPLPRWNPVDDEVPALLGPILLSRTDARPRLPRTATPALSTVGIVQLNGTYLRERLLPELARRSFGAPDGCDYTVVIVRRDDPARVVFRTDPGAEALRPGEAATAGLFDVRLDEGGEEAVADLALPPRAPGAGRVAVLGIAFGPGRPPGREGTRGDGGRWRLVVRHRGGTVDAVVAAARRQNLGLGAGALLLLAASAVLVVLSAQRARRLADRQLEFVAGVSHELRTPLAVICSAGENLADGIVADADGVRQYGRVVRDEGRRLAEMVEGVLDLAGTYSGGRRWRAEDVSVAGLLAECAAALGPALRRPGLVLESRVEPGLPPVRADRAALARAVQNLLVNAVRHGGEGGWIGLRAGLSHEGGRAEVQIAVEDRGPGIPASEVARLFEPFFRGERAAALQVRGSGLGLSLVKRIVEAHGGTVSVRTQPGLGSAFTIGLPAVAPPRGPEPPAGGRA